VNDSPLSVAQREVNVSLRALHHAFQFFTILSTLERIVG